MAIVGGTHGNEKNGVYLAKYFQSSEQARSRPSFESTVILSNVAAIKKNVRYVEEDMNRCFFMKDLANAEHTATLEARRAKEIDGIIGPKRPKLAPAMDFVIDLHNTTANTGVALMMAPDDDFAHAVGAHLMSIDKEVRIANWVQGAEDWPMLPSIGRSGMTFEVGACPWGCVVGSWYERSRKLLLATLDYIELHNQAIANSSMAKKTIQIPVFQKAYKTIDYPRDAEGDLCGMIHPDLQDKDFVKEMEDGDPLFLMLDGTTKVFSKQDYDVPPEEPVYPFFVNEAAYYEKATALMLAKRVERSVDVINQ